MRRSFLLFICLFLLAGDMAIEAASARREADAYVRVAILRNIVDCQIQINGPYVIRDAQSLKELEQQPRLALSPVRVKTKNILIGLQEYPMDRLLLEPQKNGLIRVNRREFRGSLLIIAKDDRLTLVNSINMEDYIKGVLYHEISHRWPMESIKAQAVATRTYALYSMAKNTKKDFDVTNDIYSQVYGGKNSERYRTGLAVERTRGEVLFYQGKILPAYFHATCAGRTENAKELWNVELAPLSGVPCNFCEESPHRRWKINLRLKDIQDTLNAKGYGIGAIKDIRILERNESDRIRNLEILDRDGGRLVVSGKDFRDSVGPNVLRSNNYIIQMQGYYVDFIGKGWGHGVGLCQWGARGMAMQQFNYQQILKYYYPKARIVDYHDYP